MGSYLVLLQMGFALPRLLPVARCALTAPFHPYSLQSGIFSVALSVGSRLPGVTWHFALWSPDFPPSLFAEQKETATVRSTLQAPEYRRNALPASSPGGTRPRPTSYLRSSAAWYNRFLRTPVISAAIAAARLSGISANSRSSTRSASALTALSSSGACQPSTSTTHSPRC